MQGAAISPAFWSIFGLLYALTLLPLAAFARGRATAALVFLVLAAGVFGAAILFAHFAVDIDPPKLSSDFVFLFAAPIAALAAALGVWGSERLLAKAAPLIERLVRGLGRVSIVLILAMAAIQFSAVILRYVFGVNLIAVQESVTYLHGAVFLLAGGYALLTDDHVRVDIFYRDANPRKKAIVDLAGFYLLLAPFCFVALWAAVPYVANSWAVREGSVEQSGIRGVYLLKTLIPIYLTLLVLAGVVITARAAAILGKSG
jgi:TRAP-type mannitol/chloroaromatic compound transport system permease small subunit